MGYSTGNIYSRWTSKHSPLYCYINLYHAGPYHAEVLEGEMLLKMLIARFAALPVNRPAIKA